MGEKSPILIVILWFQIWVLGHMRCALCYGGMELTPRGKGEGYLSPLWRYGLVLAWLWIVRLVREWFARRFVIVFFTELVLNGGRDDCHLP